MYKSFIIILLTAFTVSCVEPKPARLPEPTAEVQDPAQWRDFCRREGQQDPACKQN
jgi:hypothetical protein